ncbi:MAG: DUF4190 domain-containing protein [Armatimonadota bacterium]
MAFEQVTLRTPDGQDYGPVTMDVLMDWHRQGRVPPNGFIVDAVSGEVCPVADFPTLAIPPPPMPGSPMMVATTMAPAAPTSTDHLIPTKNPNALAAYYCGCFGVACAIPLGPIALILGIKGLKDSERLAVGKTHAWVGIIFGGLETLAIIIGLIFLVIGLIESNS